MTEYNIELASADNSIRVLLKTTEIREKYNKTIKKIQRAVVRSEQPSQGGAGVPTTGIFDTLKILNTFTLKGYIDNLADADGSTTTRETKRDNLILIIKKGQNFVMKFDDLDASGTRTFSVNVDGQMEIVQKSTDIGRFEVTLPLAKGTSWGVG